jgi:hypothetical protein
MEKWGQVESKLGKLSETLNEKTFCKRLIGSVNVEMAYLNDVDKVIKKRKESGVLMMDRHSKVGPEELSRKWNIGLQTVKDTLDATTQHGVRMAVHPMLRQLRVDHLHLHRPRLKGMWFLDTMIAKVKSLDKICMMMTRLACNRAIESSYWRMDNNSDVGLLMGYVLYRLLIELESMDLDTFPVDSDCTLLCSQVDRTRYSSIASGNNCKVQLCVFHYTLSGLCGFTPCTRSL